jgi:hypothetical protein
VRLTRISIVCAVLLLLAAAPALAFPKVLGVAIDRAYAPKKIHLNGICYKHIKTKLYVLASVDYVKTDKPSTLALRYVKGAGWLAAWRDGKVLPAVPKRIRSQTRAAVRSLRAQCA